jgi:tRNA-Thr(GGU) m(6)t(6)A37 methyltransferase TsaA
MDFQFQTIGILHSCFKERFGIPRQPGLVAAARGVLELHPPFSRLEHLEGLEGFSHLWVLYVFHALPGGSCRAKVRPPRLGGNRRMGVFSTRSVFRPNPLGLSLVELVAIESCDGHGRLHLKGIDILDATPVLDIKPYLPYAEALVQARGGFAAEKPEAILAVRFGPAAKATLGSLGAHEARELAALIDQTLSLDPRPAYYRRRAPKQHFGMRLAAWEVRWEVRGDLVWVTDLIAAVP